MDLLEWCMMDYFSDAPIVVYLSVSPLRCPAAFEPEGDTHPRVELYREPTAGQVRSLQRLRTELGGDDMTPEGHAAMVVRRIAIQSISVGGDLSLYARKGLVWGESLEERESFVDSLTEGDVTRLFVAIRGSEAIDDDAKKK